MFHFVPNKDAKYRYDYSALAAELNRAKSKGDDLEALGIMRKFCKIDLFFLMFFVLNMPACNHPWIVDRIYEVQDAHDRTLDLWGRAHWKTNIATYALSIQKMLNNPEVRIAIFSETRQVAKSFLRRIKITLEENALLMGLFQDIFYTNPERQSPKWSEDEGLIIKRKSAYNEATVEAWGLDGLPAGKHFDIMIFDDIVTESTVASPAMMMKQDNAFKLSFGLASNPCEVRVIGTIYHYNDLNQQLSESGEWFVRKYPAEVNGKPVLLTAKQLASKKKDMGSYVYACQMMLDPIPTDRQAFKMEWIRYYRTRPENVNIAIFCDPANADEKRSDHTVYTVIGVDALHNYYLFDMVRDRLDLVRRWEKLRDLVQRWGCRTVHYEVTGQGQIDIQYFKERQIAESVYFDIIPLKNMRVQKETRILNALSPLFEAGQFFLPDNIVYYDGEEKRHDLIHNFITEEYIRFPYAAHDDMLDCMSQIKNADAKLNAPYTAAPVMQKKQRSIFDDDVSHVTFMGM